MRKEIKELLESDLSSLHIAKQSGVEQSTVYRLRSGERKLDNLGLDKAEKLYKYAKESLIMKNKVYDFLKENFEVVSDHNESNYQHLKVQNGNYIIYYSSNGYYDSGSFEIYNRTSGKLSNGEVSIKEGDEHIAIDFIKDYQ